MSNHRTTNQRAHPESRRSRAGRHAKRTFFRRLRVESLEDRRLLDGGDFGLFPEASEANPEMRGTPGDDRMVVRKTASESDVEVLLNGGVIYTGGLAAVRSLALDGLGGDDTFVVDFGPGVFILSGGIRVNGDAGFDTLQVTGGAFATATKSFTAADSGEIVLDTGSETVRVSYSGLEPIDLSGIPLVDYVFNLPGQGDMAILEDDGIPGNGISRIRSQAASPTFESVTFSNPSSSLTINMGADSGTLDVAALPDLKSALIVNGQQGDDQVVFRGSASLSTLTVSVNGSISAAAGADLTATGNAGLSGSSIALGGTGQTMNFGTLTFNAAGSVSIQEASSMALIGSSTAGTTANLNAPGVVEDSGASISAQNLRLRGTGTITLDQATNDVGVLAASVAGPLTYADANTLTIGMVQDTNGIAAAGGVTLSAQSVTVSGGVGVSSQGLVTITVPQNILLNAGSSIMAQGTDCSVGVTLQANLSGTAAGNFTGIELNGASVTTNVGFIKLEGRGGNTGGSNYGVRLQNGSVVSAGGCCPVTVTGTGGASAGGDNVGVLVEDAGTQITSGGGPVTVTGTGGGVGASANNVGVALREGGQILGGAGCCGVVSVSGTGGNTTGDANHGVALTDSGSKISSQCGAVAVMGTGSGSGSSGLSRGAAVYAGGEISAGGSGTVTVSGTGGGGSGEKHQGVFVLGTDSIITSNGGDVSVTGRGGGTGLSPYNSGVDVAGGRITAGGQGTVTVCGTGGATSGIDNHGVILRSGAGTTITSSGGNVLVSGQGGGAGGSRGNEGVVVAEAGMITAGGSGTVTVCGRGGTGTGGSNDGVRVTGSGSAIGSGGVDLLICATAGTGADSQAVQLELQGVIRTTGKVRMTASGKVWEDAASNIVASMLGIDATGDVLLGAGANAVNLLAVQAGGGVEFNNAGPLTIGTVDSASGSCCVGSCTFAGLSGIAAAGGVTLYAQRVTVNAGVGVSSQGSVTITVPQNILLNAGSSVTVQGTNCSVGVTLRANVSGTTTGAFTGIELNGASVTTQVGFIDIEGHGGNTGNWNIGVYLHGGSRVSAGDACPVTVRGISNTPLGHTNYGVVVGNGSEITSAGGAVTVTGTGGATISEGVLVYGGSRIFAAGAGAVVVNGHGSIQGVDVDGSRIASDNGDVTVTGSNDDPGNASVLAGVWVRGGGRIAAEGTGTVTVTGKGGTGPGNKNVGVYVYGSGSEISSTAGDVRVSGEGGGQGIFGWHQGVAVKSGGTIAARGGGAVTICGVGGKGTGLYSHGVWVDGSKSRITSGGGEILICAQAGGGNNSMAVELHAGGAIGDSTARPDVRIAATGTVREDATSAIVADELGIDAVGGSVLLGDGLNDVNTLAVKATGAVSFRDLNDLTIDTVSGRTAGCCVFPDVKGISAGQDVSVTTEAGGSLVVKNRIDGLHVVLIVGGSLLVSGMTDPATLGLSANDDVTITAPMQATGMIWVKAGRDGSGSVVVAGAGNLTTTAAGSVVSLQTGATSGNIDLTGSVINAGSGAIDLVAAGDVTTGTLTAGTVSIRSYYGAIQDASDAGTDFDAAAVTLNGRVAPGGTGTGVLSAAGELTIGTGSTLDIQLNGGTPGSGHDQLRAPGPVELNGVTLELSGVIAANAGEQIVVIDNRDTDAMAGSGFLELAEESKVVANGLAFVLSLTNGPDGNDVTLTQTGAPPPPWQNLPNRFDVSGDGRLEPLDVLMMINEINGRGYSDGNGNLPVSRPAGQIPFFDVTGDNRIEPIDVLEAINKINGLAYATTWPMLSIGDAQGWEGSQLAFTVSLSAASSQVVTVHFATADGTAAAADYSSASGVLTIPAGQTTARIVVAASADPDNEPDETFTVRLSAPSQAGILRGEGVGKILAHELYSHAEPVASCCAAMADVFGDAEDTGEMAYLNNGEIHYQAIDLAIPGRGLDWEFVRTYRSDVQFDGPLGHNWEFNYNQRLRIVTADNLGELQLSFPDATSGDVILLGGSNRAELYVLNADGTYTAPRGSFTECRKKQGDGYEIRDPDGTVDNYATPDADGRAVMVSRMDRNGNTLQFQRNALGQLTSVLDTLGRLIDYMYNPAGQLIEVRDFAGRSLRFSYDSNGDLVAVTAPAVIGTPTGNDFPQGKTERYTYSAGFADEKFNHNLLTTTAPNEVAVNGPPRVIVSYDTSVTSPDADRVRSLSLGGVNDTGVPGGGTIHYAYQALVPPVPPGPATPVFQTAVTDRNGNRTEYQFNPQGNIVTKTEFMNRSVRPGDPDFFETSYQWNQDYQLLERTAPEGNRLQFAYHSGDPDRLQQGNLLSITQRPDPDRGGDQGGTTTSYTYEPLFNQLRQATDARGYTTTYYFDYQEGHDLAALAAHLGVTEAEVAQLLAGSVPPVLLDLGDLNGDGVIGGGSAGNIVRIEYPSVDLSSQPEQAAVEGGTTQTIVERRSYNQYGQLTRQVDPEGNVNLYQYFSAADPDGDGTPTATAQAFDFNGSSNLTEPGYIGVGGTETYTAARGYGWATAAAEFQRSGPTALDRDGHYGSGGGGNTFQVQVTPGAQYQVQVRVGDSVYPRDQIQVTVEGAAPYTIGTLSPGVFDIRTTSVPVAATADGLLAITIRDLGGDPYWVINGLTVTRVLDAVTGGYLKQVTRDTASDPIRDSRTNPPPANIRTQYQYDAVGNVTRQVDGRGIATDYVANQLNQVVQIVHGAAHDPAALGEPLALTDFAYLERFFYDHNGNVVVHQVEDRGNTSGVDGNPPTAALPAVASNPDPLGGPAFVDTVFKYDLLDDQIEMLQEVAQGTAAEFLRTRYRYDPNQNPVLTIQPEGNATRAYYDERDLLFQSGRGGLTPPPLVLLGTADPIDYDVRGGLPCVCVTYRYDGNGNVIETADPDDTDLSDANNSDFGDYGDRTRYVYDGFDHLTSVIDAVGNQTVYQYDPAGHVVRSLQFGPVGGPSPIADGPDFLAGPVSVLGVIQAANLVNANLLRATESSYDELGRLFQTDQVLFVNTIPTVRPPDVADGAVDLGKGDPTPADNQAIPGVSGVTILGRVTERTEYDRNSRVTFVVQDDGDTSRTFYDGAGRVLKTVDPQGNTAEYAYDGNSNVIETRQTDVAQVPGVAPEVFLTTNFYDSLNRLQQTVDNLGQSTSFRYDSRGNVVATADAEGPLTGASISRRVFSDGPRTVNAINDFGNVTLYTDDGLNRQIRQELILTASGQGDGVHIGATLEGVKTTTPVPDTAQGGGDGIIRIGTVYDANSLVSARLDDQGNVTLYTHDNLNRRVTDTKGLTVNSAPLNKPKILGSREIVGPTAATINNPYAIPAAKIDAQLAKAEARLDAEAAFFTALADEIDDDPPTTIMYGYSPDDDLLIVEDENDSETFTRYDAVHRPIAARVFRAGQSDSHAGDPLFAPAPLADPSNPSTAFPAVGGTTTQDFQYDGLSRLVRATDNNDPVDATDNSVITYAYDSLGRVIEETQQIGVLPAQAISSAWRAENLRSELVYPNGRELQYRYDALDRLNTVTDAGAPQPIADYDYIGTSRVLVRAYPINGTRETYLNDAGTIDDGYDGLGRPVQLRHLRSDNSLVVGFDYIYDRTGNKLTETKLHDTANNEVYGYDSAGRLIHFGRPNPGSIAPLHSDWTLDGAGNWQQVDGETREHSSFNEITQRSEVVTTTLASDDNGNETDDGTYRFTWDAKNRLRTVTRKADGALVATSWYDAEGRRIRKVVTNSGPLDGTTDFYLDGNREIEDRNAAGVLTQHYVYGIYIDEVLAMDRNLNGDGTATGPGDRRLFYHQNTLYSTHALTDATPAIQVPAGGGAAIVDGETFTVGSGSQTFTFEFDSNGVISPGNIAIPFTPAGTQDQIASAVATALQNSGAATDARNLGGGLVDLGMTTKTVDTSTAPSLRQSALVREGDQYDAYGRPTVFTPGPNGVVNFGADDVVLVGGSSSLGNPFLFSGRRLDAETGLYYYRTRYLDPVEGRFISRDSIGIWGDPANLGNGYAYVGNTPQIKLDPTGKGWMLVRYYFAPCKCWLTGLEYFPDKPSGPYSQSMSNLDDNRIATGGGAGTGSSHAGASAAIGVARAWKDPEYRASLSGAQLAALPANPAGQMAATDSALAMVSRRGEPLSNLFGCPNSADQPCYSNAPCHTGDYAPCYPPGDPTLAVATNASVVRAWKDPDYRASLSAAQRAALPANPAGHMASTGSALAMLSVPVATNWTCATVPDGCYDILRTLHYCVTHDVVRCHPDLFSDRAFVVRGVVGRAVSGTISLVNSSPQGSAKAFSTVNHYGINQEGIK